MDEAERERLAQVCRSASQAIGMSGGEPWSAISGRRRCQWFRFVDALAAANLVLVDAGMVERLRGVCRLFHEFETTKNSVREVDAFDEACRLVRSLTDADLGCEP